VVGGFVRRGGASVLVVAVVRSGLVVAVEVVGLSVVVVARVVVDGVATEPVEPDGGR
jgi:hypothetical protein